MSSKWSWVLIVVFCMATLGWGYFNYLLIPDRGEDQPLKRQWDFGILPDAPSQSIYSSSQPAQAQGVPPQIPQLPEAHPPVSVPPLASEPAGENP